MTDPSDAIIKTKRILVTIDTSARGRAALEAAIQLALDSSAELQGLFVEDEDLVRLAALPFACEVDFTSASSRQLHTVSMQRDLRLAAQRTEQAFAAALRQLKLRWTFRVVRGTVVQASLAAAGDVDLLVIGQQGCSTRMMASDSLPQPVAASRHVVAVVDGSPASFRALPLAADLAASISQDLSVWVLAKNGDEATRRCMAWLRQQGVHATVEQLSDPSEDALVEFARTWPPGVLLINRGAGFVTDVQIRRFVNEFDCPLVLC